MKQVQKGDTIRVHYVGKLTNGIIFDETLDDDPFEFTIGADEVLPDFENAFIGMTVGDKKTFQINAANAYGDYDDEAFYAIEYDLLPPDIEPELGLDLKIKMPDGSSEVMTIVELEEDTIILDANHPLAGEDLIFTVELVEIVE
jgi:FKBP-type peptidyl-prolyl cis-trans isomerase 2